MLELRVFGKLPRYLSNIERYALYFWVTAPFGLSKHLDIRVEEGEKIRLYGRWIGGILKGAPNAFKTFIVGIRVVFLAGGCFLVWVFPGC